MDPNELAKKLYEQLRKDQKDATIVPLEIGRAKEVWHAALKEVLEMEQPIPFISGKAAAIAAAIGTFLTVCAGVASSIEILPPWAPFTLSALGAIALFLAGKAVPPLKVGGSLVPAVAVPTLLALSAALVTFASQLPAGKAQAICVMVASLVGGLAGKMAPQEVKP